MEKRNERGQVTILTLLVSFLLIAASFAVLLGVTQVYAWRNQAQIAADAASLASASNDGSRAEAARAASKNGAKLIAFAKLGDDVIVTTSSNGIKAKARATLEPKSRVGRNGSAQIGSR
jgi:uncharacterized membrane protein